MTTLSVVQHRGKEEAYYLIFNKEKQKKSRHNWVFVSQGVKSFREPFSSCRLK
jgi:glutamine phosphoribosylpyrophosphate amidotransferase